MVGSGIDRLLAARGEYIRAKKLQKLAASRRDASATPLADAWRADLAKARHGGGSAQLVDDFGVIHGASIGIPMASVNRHP